MSSSRCRRVAVIGSINHDIVIRPDGRRQAGWGGILFNIAALHKHGGRDVTIQPIAYLGSDARRPVRRWLSSSPNVDMTRLILLDRRGNLCRLRYVDSDTRTERLSHPVPALAFTQIRPALEADLILVNFILGRDLQVAALERLRRAYTGEMYIDVHSYLLGRRKDGTRFPRRPTGWKRIIACADFLQVNETEFRTLTGQAMSATAVHAWARRVLTPLRCSCIIVTLGARGAICTYRRGRRWSQSRMPAARRPASIDPTGAGDTFTGAWIAYWLVSQRDPVAATRYATRAAARPARPAI